MNKAIKVLGICQIHLTIHSPEIHSILNNQRYNKTNIEVVQIILPLHNSVAQNFHNIIHTLLQVHLAVITGSQWHF